MILHTYIVQYVHDYGSGWALMCCPSPGQIEGVLRSQSRCPTARVTSFREIEYVGNETSLVAEGNITTYAKTPYDLAVLNGFTGTEQEWLESLKGETGDSATINGLPTLFIEAGDHINIVQDGNRLVIEASGVADYESLDNHPSINDVELTGNKTSSDLGLASASDIPDVSQFITNSANDLINYYLKTETYTQSEVNNLIGAISQFHYEIATSTSAVTNPQSNVLYLIGPTGTGLDQYEEYVYPNSTAGFIKIGDTSIDLSGYVTTSALNTALANYTTTADLTTLLAGKQDTISDLATIRSGAALGTTSIQSSEKGVASGVATLDSGGKVPNSQLTIDNTIQQGSQNPVKGAAIYNMERQIYDTITASVNSLAEGKLDVPATAGTSGQVLTSDGQGGHSWQTPTSAVSDVTVGGTSVVSNGTAVIPSIPTVPTTLSSFTDDLGSSPTHTHSQYLTSHQDITGKADKVASATSGNFAALDSNGNPTDSGHKHSDYLTSHQDLSNYVQKSQTAGLLKNDGTVDTTQYGTYSKPSGGIPASDLASGVIPTVPTNVSAFTNDANYLTSHQDISGKADKITVASSMPSGGFLPNVVYNLGTLSGDTSFTMAAATDNTIANIWCWTFTTPSTAPTITWPAAILEWNGGNAPTISASKHYEISVMEGVACFIETDIPTP